MVSVKSLVASALAALPLTSAYITNIAVPATAKAGDKIPVTLTASIYIQNWDDFGIVWGVKPTSWNCGDIVCVGRRIAYTSLFPDNQPKPGQSTIDVTLPSDLQPGDYNIVAAIPYLVGASGETEIQGHSANITIEA
ncbi:uncharacterized protein F4812DRAFT_310760 [Daldinia caldariorum]|uniref:uncharacterized protein n=1 Tax=Daldinia caldariorum TaxID=326644 RepID=UPI00200883EB|nr:uncharacterized protein F4812DRAFT_310760 [Daldinia caldariorum]KAI1470035.1 hypothetical protein F4812DRAFT_310760 [Daldinia caldariorum]